MNNKYVSVPRELAFHAVIALEETGQYGKADELQSLLSRAMPSDELAVVSRESLVMILDALNSCRYHDGTLGLQYILHQSTAKDK